MTVAMRATAQAGKSATDNQANNAPAANSQGSNGSAAPPASQSKVQATQIGAVSTVKDNVVVTAGLLTQPSATQLFGGWTAEHFLVVQVTIGNQSRDQQFVLHDIFLDYSNWKLSGIYDDGATNTTQCAQTAQGVSSCLNSRPLQDYQSGTQSGQISSIGALEVQEALKQNSVFSKRNFFVNGLVMIGATAGGFIFLGPPGFTQGVAGFSSNFLPALQKFWPDRRIDQQSNVLKYGFQDKMVIAKEDPGKTYAFFPIERMLTTGLVEVYRKDPAVFLNMAELYFDPPFNKEWYAPSTYTKSNKQLDYLKKLADDLLYEQLKYTADSRISSPPDNCSTLLRDLQHTKKLTPDMQNCIQFNARILSDLFSPCYFGKNSPNAKDGEPGCTLVAKPDDNLVCPTLMERDADKARRSDASEKPNSGEDKTPVKPIQGQDPADCKLQEIRGVKDTIAGLSLNKIRVVVNGIMTVDVDLIPGVLTKITFEDSSTGKSKWDAVPSEISGVIEGKYLTNGTPEITAIKLKDSTGSTITGDDIKKSYVTSLTVDRTSSTDSELHFTLSLNKQIADGSVLTFRVNKSSSKSVN
ncbi:MAG: hypothetical protein JOZ83_02740, partial [Silvibacterium sp.]|nr:hypothetical protein [Silvibacterium sp.]